MYDHLTVRYLRFIDVPAAHLRGDTLSTRAEAGIDRGE